MKIYFAPLEGITGYVFRNVYARHFGGIDTYFAPFLSPAKEKRMTPKERRDICPENNSGISLVPQLLTNRADYFLKAAKELQTMGYQEVNLNLGCPSGTVVAKKKGAGCLRDVEALDAFLYEIFEKAEVFVSVKTRIGMEDEKEFEELLPVFNRYKMKELIIHPRVQKDMYRNRPRMEVFSMAMKESTNTLCYNGDITTDVEFRKIEENYPELESMMIGRGLLANPGLASYIKTGKPVSKEELYHFCVDLCKAYQEVMSGEKNVLFKMKEMWLYLSKSFQDSEKYLKKIKKAQHLSEYEIAVKKLFAECDLDEIRCGGKCEKSR